MGFFSGGEDEETEEVKIGLSDSDDSGSSSEDSAEVRDIDFGSNKSDSDSESSLENEVRSSMPGVETSGNSSSSGEDVSLDDIHEQNEEIKRKLDTLISQI